MRVTVVPCTCAPPAVLAWASLNLSPSCMIPVTALISMQVLIFNALMCHPD